METIVFTIGAMVMGITAVVTQTGYLKSNFKPLFALVLGVTLTLGIYGLTRDMFVAGVIASLSAMGLWSGGKATLEREEPLG